jgi:ABC-2 type transport system ATP-binding protein
MDEPMPLLEVTGLAAGYGRTRIVDGVDLCVQPGTWLGLLGANGSGKSTLLRAITGQIRLQAGRVLIGGIDLAEAPERAKQQFGYAVDGADLPEALTALQYLELVASIRGCAADAWPCGDLIGPLALQRWMHMRIGDCSLGTRMKISLAGALLDGPPLLILDESLNGLDPVASWRIRGILRELVEGGHHAVVLSTHMLETVATNCSDVVFLDGGAINHRWHATQLEAARNTAGGFEALVMQALLETRSAA